MRARVDRATKYQRAERRV